MSSFQGLTWLGSWSVVCWKIPSSSRSFLTECADRWKLSSLPPGGLHSAPSPVPPLDLWRDYRETLWIQDLRSTNGGGKRFLCSDALAPDHTGFCPWKIFENLWSKNIFNMSCVLNVKLSLCWLSKGYKQHMEASWSLTSVNMVGGTELSRSCPSLLITVISHELNPVLLWRFYNVRGVKFEVSLLHGCLNQHSCGIASAWWWAANIQLL